MRKQDIRRLFDYNYWATWQLLTAMRQVSDDAFVASTDITWRSMRDTMVHTLDVEQSWRKRLQGLDRKEWDASLPPEQFRRAEDVEAAWRSDAAATFAWLDELDDDALAAEVDLGPKDRFPMWYFLVHIVTHGIEQRRDAATLLRHAGHEAPELEFLWFADSLATGSP